MKLATHRASLPGQAVESRVRAKEVSFHCAPSCLLAGRDPASPASAGRGTFRPNPARSDEPKVNKVQMKPKAQMAEFGKKEELFILCRLGIYLML